jgi:hypothetical protein
MCCVSGLRRRISVCDGKDRWLPSPTKPDEFEGNRGIAPAAVGERLAPAAVNAVDDEVDVLLLLLLVLVLVGCGMLPLLPPACCAVDVGR